MWVNDIPRNFAVGEVFTHTEPADYADEDDRLVVEGGRWRITNLESPKGMGPACQGVDVGMQTWTPYDYERTWVWRPQPAEPTEDRVALVMELIAEMQA